MSNNLSYVRTEMLPEKEPPASTTGAIGWIRANLFSGTFNSILTIVSLAFIVFLLVAALPWLFSPTWNAASLNECRGILAEMGREGHFAGACWGVIRDRWVQLFFGFYPADLYWRPILAFVLLAVALAPVLFSEKVPAKLIWFTALFPVIFPWILWGGAFWGPLAIVVGVVLSYFVYKIVERATSSLFGLIATVLFLALWFVWGVGSISSAIDTSVGSARIDSRVAAVEADIETRKAEAASLDENLKAAIAAAKPFEDKIKAKAQVLKLRASVEGFEAEIPALEAEVKRAQEAIAALAEGDEKAAAEKKLASLQSTLDGLPGKIEKANADIEKTLASAELVEGGNERGIHSLIAEVKPQRDEIGRLRSEKGIVDKRLSDLESLKRRADLLPELEAKLPELTEEAAKARAALPDTVSHVRSNNGFKSLQLRNREEGLEIPKEDMAALDAVLTQEGTVALNRSTIESTYADIARVGFEPVKSRDFGGMMLSLTIGVVAIAMSLPLGILLALGRQSDLPLLKALCVGFIEFIRGVPLITLLFVASTLLNIFLPPGTNFDIILRVIIMATLFASAYMAEVIRGGLAALPTGQYEGADSLGLNYWQAQRLIIMPQALKISIPGIVSTFIGLFKDTVLVSIIGLLDPLGLSNAIRADAAWNGIVWEIYGFIGLMFFVFCFSMSRYSMYLERKLHTGHSR